MLKRSYGLTFGLRRWDSNLDGRFPLDHTLSTSLASKVELLLSSTVDNMLFKKAKIKKEIFISRT